MANQKLTKLKVAVELMYDPATNTLKSVNVKGTTTPTLPGFFGPSGLVSYPGSNMILLALAHAIGGGICSAHERFGVSIEDMQLGVFEVISEAVQAKKTFTYYDELNNN